VPGFRVFGGDADVVGRRLFASRTCRGHTPGVTTAPGRARSRTPRERRSQPVDMIVLGRVEGSVPEAAPLCPLDPIDPQ